MRRTVLVVTSIGLLGLGVGLALPRSAPMSALLVVIAVVSLVAVTTRTDALAPSHSLNGVVRLPTTAAVSATLESVRSRIVGTTQGLRQRAPQPSPLAPYVLDYGPDEFVRPIDANAPDHSMN
jgi:hypothetical protein